MRRKLARLLLCNCEKSMQIDSASFATALNIDPPDISTQLCRAEVERYESALTSGVNLCVACTQESPLFTEIAEETGATVPYFFNIRELAGWSRQGKQASPKMAALAAAAMHVSQAARLKTIESDGLCLVAGSGQAALDAASLLNRNLSVTLLLESTDDLILPSTLDFPIFSGRIVRASGSFGAFEVTVDGYASMLPSSRGEPQFAMARDGTKSRCSVIFDLGGSPGLFAGRRREGYFRVDPGDPAAMMRAILDASQFAGEFEKPIYVSYDADICAHSRSQKTGCSKCLDNCPPGAITPDSDNILVDSAICGGCGNCASHCPTGAIYYNYPNRHDAIERVQLLAAAYLDAGGRDPVLLIHEASHGLPILNVMARLGEGLPANVIPMEFHSPTSVGHDFLSAALAAGFRDVFFLANPRRSGELASLREEIALMDAILSGCELSSDRISLIEADDPEVVENTLYDRTVSAEISRKSFDPIGSKREVARTALTILGDSGNRPAEPIALPSTAPYGTVNVDIEACTLCLSCVSACPMDALRDNPDKPQLRFVESACVQCGICKSTCPESAITLEARLDLSPAAMQPRVLHEEEPAECIRCGKPFAARSTIERIAEKLGGRHSMYMDEHRLRLLRMCENCRLEELSEGGADPFAIAGKRPTRTTDDYLAAEKQGLSVDDFFSDD